MNRVSYAEAFNRVSRYSNTVKSGREQNKIRRKSPAVCCAYFSFQLRLNLHVECFSFFSAIITFSTFSSKNSSSIIVMVLLKTQPPNGDRSFAFPLQCFMLKFNGAWPLKHDEPHGITDICYLTWAYALIILIALTCYVQAAYLFASWGDVLVVTECGCTVFMGLHNLLRLIHLSYERQALKNLIIKFTKDIWISK